MPLKTATFDAAFYLKTPEARAAYLAAALETGGEAEIADAHEVLARAVKAATQPDPE